ncbi:bestrophin (plasmid) [Caballeronia sp. NK8]|nr:bestrophin [Caballeronia sp. NK8]
MGIVSSPAVLTQGRIFGEKIPLKGALHIVRSRSRHILAFRNNASYERFKEARLLWGNLLISARSLTSQILCYVPPGSDSTHIARTLIACIYALKHELRRTDPVPDLLPLLGRARTEALHRTFYKSTALLNDVRRDVADLQTRSLASETKRWMFDAQINELGKAIGGCERIASTPIPFSYSVLLHRTVYAYCILLPFGLVDSTEFFTPLLCVFISYTLIALEAIASEVAVPFSVAPNELALDAITRNIERSILELRGCKIPDEVVPVRPYQLT